MNPEFFHPIESSNMYIAVIVPIAVPKPYTYIVPSEMIKDIKIGIRVEVQFGKNKLYSALVMKILDDLEVCKQIGLVNQFFYSVSLIAAYLKHHNCVLLQKITD